jgi:hypothetical protein
MEHGIDKPNSPYREGGQKVGFGRIYDREQPVNPGQKVSQMGCIKSERDKRRDKRQDKREDKRGDYGKIKCRNGYLIQS